MKKTKKAQGVDEEGGAIECNFIDLGVLEVDDGATTEMFYQSDEDLYEEKARMQAAAAAAEETYLAFIADGWSNTTDAMATETAGVKCKPMGDIPVGIVGLLETEGI